ncbi:hypothetical protein GOBAR_DD30240 [Gossypium barbadense]|nr:hypothetical protein GOBAR_DD30240 [Gossypium barbadense]
MPGALGTSASLALRLGQTVFSVASLLFMCLDIEFYSYTSFRKLVMEYEFLDKVKNNTTSRIYSEKHNNGEGRTSQFITVMNYKQ